MQSLGRTTNVGRLWYGLGFGIILRGSGLVNFGFSLFRRFSIREKAMVEVHGGFFNLFNRPRFNLPNRSVDVPRGGVINSLQPARRVQPGMRLMF